MSNHFKYGKDRNKDLDSKDILLRMKDFTQALLHLEEEHSLNCYTLALLFLQLGEVEEELS
jgi:hypothetical protein